MTQLCSGEHSYNFMEGRFYFLFFLALGKFFIYLLISEGQYFSFRHISVEFIVYLLLYYFVVKKINTSFLLVFVSL